MPHMDWSLVSKSGQVCHQHESLKAQYLDCPEFLPPQPPARGNWAVKNDAAIYTGLEYRLLCSTACTIHHSILQVLLVCSVQHPVQYNTVHWTWPWPSTGGQGLGASRNYHVDWWTGGLLDLVESVNWWTGGLVDWWTEWTAGLVDWVDCCCRFYVAVFTAGWLQVQLSGFSCRWVALARAISNMASDYQKTSVIIFRRPQATKTVRQTISYCQ